MVLSYLYFQKESITRAFPADSQIHTEVQQARADRAMAVSPSNMLLRSPDHGLCANRRGIAVQYLVIEGKNSFRDENNLF